MQKLSALLVDDEIKALQLLGMLLEDTCQFSEIRKANSVPAASAELERFAPDLIFLDIKMPGEDGIAFLRKLWNERTTSEIVFVTAHDQFAMEALRNHAFGYLLKPVSRDELSECIRHFNEHIRRPGYLDRLEKFLQMYDSAKLRFNTRAGYVFIEPSTILCCEADGNYTTIQMGNTNHVCSIALGVVETMLPATGFVRLGRSLIVNLKNVARVDRKASQITFERDELSYIIKVTKSQLRELDKKQNK